MRPWTIYVGGTGQGPLDLREPTRKNWCIIAVSRLVRCAVIAGPMVPFSIKCPVARTKQN